MIQVLNQIEALYFLRAGYNPYARPYERKTYVASPDAEYRGGPVSTNDRGAQI
ncbi:hypothetical protein J2X43_000134 [Rhizobium sp. BE258]|nr:hypothetical protein [Rhizobium sp. BE258]